MRAMEMRHLMDQSCSVFKSAVNIRKYREKAHGVEIMYGSGYLSRRLRGVAMETICTSSLYTNTNRDKIVIIISPLIHVSSCLWI